MKTKIIPLWFVVVSLILCISFSVKISEYDNDANTLALQKLYKLEYEYLFNEDSLNMLATASDSKTTELLFQYEDNRFTYEMNYMESNSLSPYKQEEFFSKLYAIDTTECSTYIEYVIKQYILYDELLLAETSEDKIVIYESLRNVEPYVKYSNSAEFVENIQLLYDIRFWLFCIFILYLILLF